VHYGDDVLANAPVPVKVIEAARWSLTAGTFFTSSRPQAFQHPRERYRLADVVETAHPSHDALDTHGDISAATFRDLRGASRRFSIALLDYFDRTGFTLRVGDVRKLRRVPK